jgi:hypothetical protein
MLIEIDIDIHFDYHALIKVTQIAAIYVSNSFIGGGS